MSMKGFVKGMAAGLVAGATIGIILKPKRQAKRVNVKNSAGRALKTIGGLMENLGDTIS